MACGSRSKTRLSAENRNVTASLADSQITPRAVIRAPAPRRERAAGVMAATGAADSSGGSAVRKWGWPEWPSAQVLVDLDLFGLAAVSDLPDAPASAAGFDLLDPLSDFSGVSLGLEPGCFEA